MLDIPGYPGSHLFFCVSQCFERAALLNMPGFSPFCVCALNFKGILYIQHSSALSTVLVRRTGLRRQVYSIYLRSRFLCGECLDGLKKQVY